MIKTIIGIVIAAAVIFVAWLVFREWTKFDTGNDLKEMGIPPGPKFKEILLAVEEAQLDGQVSDRQGALQFARSICEA